MNTITIVAAAQTVAKALKQIDFDKHYVKSVRIELDRLILFPVGRGFMEKCMCSIEIPCVCKLLEGKKIVDSEMRGSMVWKYAYDYLQNAPDVPIEIEITENNVIRIIHQIS